MRPRDAHEYISDDLHRMPELATNFFRNKALHWLDGRTLHAMVHRLFQRLIFSILAAIARPYCWLCWTGATKAIFRRKHDIWGKDKQLHV